MIGAGFGRTGTLSLRTALERLLGGRCYHMSEVLADFKRARDWVAAARGEDMDWHRVFDGYVATVDWPACVFWSEIASAFPDAKVLLSTRPPDRWWASYSATIHQLMLRTPPPENAAADDDFAAVSEMGTLVVRERTFGGSYETLERDAIVAAYERHNAHVRATAPSDRFLEFDVVQGWKPLCAFLGVDVPDEPFPNVNDSAEFRAMFGLSDDPEADEMPSPDELRARFGGPL